VTAYTRSWLRSFLRLDARMQQDGVPLADVERQEDTVLQSPRALQPQPGLLLAYEVRMGKNFEALRVRAALHAVQRERRAIKLHAACDLQQYSECEPAPSAR